jgi:hypothetical protein
MFPPRQGDKEDNTNGKWSFQQFFRIGVLALFLGIVGDVY